MVSALENAAGCFIHTSSISASILDNLINELTFSNAANDWIGYNRTKFLAEQVENGIRQGLDAVIMNPGIIGAGDTHNWSRR